MQKQYLLSFHVMIWQGRVIESVWMRWRGMQGHMETKAGRQSQRLSEWEGEDTGKGSERQDHSQATGSLTLETSKALVHFHNKRHEQGTPILLVDGIVRMGFGLKVGESPLLLQTLLLRIYQAHLGIY